LFIVLVLVFVFCLFFLFFPTSSHVVADDSPDFMVQKKYPNPQTSIIRHVELTRQTGQVTLADEPTPNTEGVDLIILFFFYFGLELNSCFW
jgi:hypothetical protein